MELHLPGFSCALREPLHPERLESPFCFPTALPQTLFPWNFLAWLTVQVPFSLKFSPLKSQIASSTGHPDQCTLCRAPATNCTGCRLHQPKPLPRVPHLFYTWKFPHSVGNKDPSGNAALTHPLRAFTESFNPGLFSPHHLVDSPLIGFFEINFFF